MNNDRPKICALSGNALKIIAAVSMLIDHIGVIFCPDVTILRILGRIAFPIFAFMISEGCRYTRNKLRYFLTVSCMGVAYLVVFYLYSGVIYMSIFITFSLSIIMIYALQAFKKACFAENVSVINIVFLGIVFATTVAFSSAMNEIFAIDYGFFGSLAPLLASLFHKPEGCSNIVFAKLDSRLISLLGLSIALIGLYVVYGGFRIYALLSIPLLLLYSGKRGKRKMKYFFYIFYPSHILILEGIYILLQAIK